MSQSTDERVRWTIADIELLPDNGDRYEIIDGELFITKIPHWNHQKAVGNACAELNKWSKSSGLGEAALNPGIIFTDADNVIPDVVWVSKERLTMLLDEAGHLRGAPELVIEVLSEGVENQRRDREVKLKLYVTRGVQEYWILDWRSQQVEVYRRDKALLKLVETLFVADELTSLMLPKFVCTVSHLFV